MICLLWFVCLIKKGQDLHLPALGTEGIAIFNRSSFLTVIRQLIPEQHILINLLIKILPLLKTLFRFWLIFGNKTLKIKFQSHFFLASVWWFFRKKSKASKVIMQTIYVAILSVFRLHFYFRLNYAYHVIFYYRRIQ